MIATVSLRLLYLIFSQLLPCATPHQPPTNLHLARPRRAQRSEQTAARPAAPDAAGLTPNAALLAAGQPVAFDEGPPGPASVEPPSTATPTYEPPSRNTARGREAHTLTGLSTEIAHLRIALETLATTVRRHEEQLRRLRRHDEHADS